MGFTDFSAQWPEHSLARAQHVRPLMRIAVEINAEARIHVTSAPEFKLAYCADAEAVPVTRNAMPIIPYYSLGVELARRVGRVKPGRAKFLSHKGSEAAPCGTPCGVLTVHFLHPGPQC
jgi:hypothetical protein